MLARRALALAVWVACALAGWTLAARAEEDHVVVLGDKNLDDTVNSNQFVLVEFYAPWCGHCKALEPEYKKAAAELKDFEPKVILAKLDATAEKESAQAHGIQGFPTLKWFVNGKATEYGGGRTADTIVSWIKKKTGPPCKAIGSKAELDAFKESAEVVVVGAFKTKESAKAFESAALADDSVAYGLVLGDAPEDVKQALELKQAEGVVLFKKFDEGRADFTGDLADTDAVAKFVSGNELPLIVAFSQSTAPKIFGGAVKRHLLLFVDSSKDKETSDFKDTARPVAKETRGDYLFVTIDKSDSRVLEFFGITEADLPTARIVELNDAGMKKFKLLGAGAVTEESIRSTIKAHGAGELKPDLKSEEPPADNSGPVRVLTGKSFRDELKGKDVFVEFYAPWCGHCKKLAPIWDELGEKFKGKGASVVIAKMDATANEVDGVNIQGFPTLKLFRKDSDEAVDYDGERTLDGLTEFLEKQVPDSCKASA